MAADRYQALDRNFPRRNVPFSIEKGGVQLMSSCLSFVGGLISDICSITLPYGVSYGVLIVGAATFPVLLSVIKKIF